MAKQNPSCPRRGAFTVMIVAVVLVALATATTGCASGDATAYDQPPAAVRNYEALVNELEAIARRTPHLRLVPLGTVSYGGFEAPLVAVRFATVPAAPVSVLVTGGVHGNEPAGVEWTVELIRELAAAPERYAGAAIDVIPLVNPWGWVYDVRYNLDGRDINRDFASFRTQEALLLKGFLAGKTYDLVIDDHEDPDAAGFYLYQYGRRDQTAGRAVIARARELGYPIEQDVTMVILKTDDGLIDAPMWGLRYMRVTGQLSLTNYIRLTGNRTVYTIETPVTLPMRDRVAAHRLAFGMLMEEALRERGE